VVGDGGDAVGVVVMMVVVEKGRLVCCINMFVMWQIPTNITGLTCR